MTTLLPSAYKKHQRSALFQNTNKETKRRNRHIIIPADIKIRRDSSTTAYKKQTIDSTFYKNNRTNNRKCSKNAIYSFQNHPQRTWIYSLSFQNLNKQKKETKSRNYGMWVLAKNYSTLKGQTKFTKTLEEIRPHWWISFNLTNPLSLEEANMIGSLTKNKQTKRETNHQNYWS